jgi:DNA-binding transcriptional LysR family regulator
MGGMMDRLDSMAILVNAVETGTLSGAGRQMGIPLATVSRKVSELEAHLRTRLLNRSARRLTLTDAGQSYVAACRQILDQVSEAEREASGEYSAPKGKLVITAPIVFGRLHILPVAMEFLQAYPEVEIKMALSDGVLDLLEDRVDMAVRIAELPDSSHIAARVGSIRRVVCASPAYFAKRGIPTNPGDLSTHDCIVRDGRPGANTWAFGFGASASFATVRSRFSVNTAEATIDAAKAGLGITRALSYQIDDAVRAGTLCIALQDFEPDPLPVSLVYAAQGLIPLKLRAFIDFAAPRLKARFAGLGKA